MHVESLFFFLAFVTQRMKSTWNIFKVVKFCNCSSGFRKSRRLIFFSSVKVEKIKIKAEN